MSPSQPAPKAPPHKPMPVYDHPPAKVHADTVRPRYLSTMLDVGFFVFGSLASVWLTWLLAADGFSLSRLWYWIPFWVVLTYIALPRVHRILTWIYVPDYFIGRARTSDGLLGDPVNLGFRGTEEDIHQVMRDSGWSLAEEITPRSAWRMVVSSLLRRSYPTAPVSPLHLFGRRHDFAYQQEVDGNPHQRHHVRFWRTPEGWLLPGGHQADWLAAGTYDRSVGLSLFTLQVTHRIDADIDIERNYIVSTIEHHHPEVPVEVIEKFSTGYHHRNGGGDQIKTDGDLPIVDVSAAVQNDPQPHLSDGPPRRPSSLILGCALILLMSIGPAVVGIVASLDAEPVVEAEQGPALVTAMSRPAVLIALIVVTVLTLTALALATALGVVWTRTVMLFVLTALILVMGVSGIREEPALLGLWSLAILALLALSSTSVRTYVEAKRALRREARGQTPSGS
ncbi:LssY C-terminal domain-containing protein [Georgenia alba]|uniref:LssY C-terminal domain-containing protein n=1 Tax=Georgenia alba TaxID=2233858 RepID=A0ABW2Q712_9MICO